MVRPRYLYCESDPLDSVGKNIRGGLDLAKRYGFEVRLMMGGREVRIRPSSILKDLLHAYTESRPDTIVGP